MDAFAPYEEAEARREAALRDADAVEARLRAAVNSLMAEAQGRCFLRWILQQCRVFSAEDLSLAAPGGDNAAARLLFTEGRRLVGMRLLRLVQRADAAHVSNLLQTREEDLHEHDRC